MKPKGRGYRAAAVVTLLGALAALAVLLVSGNGENRLRESSEAPSTERSVQEAPQSGLLEPAAIEMQFTREGLAGSITQAVERVVRPGRARVAVRRAESARHVCILVDSPERYYELDSGLSAGDFPAFEQGGFSRPPGPVTRTTSIYRSVAKRAMGYRRDRGDWVVVLLCPRDEWDRLRVTWPR